MRSLLRAFGLGCSVVAVGVGAGAGCGSDDPSHAVADDSGGAGGETTGDAGSGAKPDNEAGADTSSAGEAAGGAPSAVVNGCEAPSGDGTDVPSAITGDQTWTYAGSPYRVSTRTYLTATLTLEPCTVVELAADAGILVGNAPEAGAIVAHGDSKQNPDGQTEERAIYFQRLDKDAAWGSLSVDPTGELDFRLVHLSGGGSLASEQNGGGTILAYGADSGGAATPSVGLQDVMIADSETYAVNLQARAAFTPDSAGLTIETSGAESGFPIYLEAGAAFSVPAGLRLDGNERDAVLVHPFTRVASDTFPARGVPFVIDQELYVATPNDDPGTATLTIEAGAELMFEGAGSDLLFGADATHPGELVAVGTAAAPIWLHSAEAAPAAGSWLGLYFAHTTPSGNKLEHAIIEDAGAFSGAKGFGCGPA
jgi:hypothetical protein